MLHLASVTVGHICAMHATFPNNWCTCVFALLHARVHPLLGSAQGLVSGQQHPFPWYPPVCTSLSDIPEGRRSADYVRSLKNRSKFPQKIPDTRMQQVCCRWLLVTTIITEFDVNSKKTCPRALTVLFVFFTPLTS